LRPWDEKADNNMRKALLAFKWIERDGMNVPEKDEILSRTITYYKTARSKENEGHSTNHENP
jgi:hypothetical protein